MELILLKDVNNLGRKGETVRVRDGFARNFLIPQKVALPSTQAGKEFVAEQKMRAEKRRAKEKAEAELKAKELEKVKLILQVPAGEQDKLFGAITNDDIRIALEAKGFSLDKKKILLKDPIRALGTYTVQVEIFPQVKSAVSVEVVRKA